MDIMNKKQEHWWSCIKKNNLFPKTFTVLEIILTCCNNSVFLCCIFALTVQFFLLLFFYYMFLYKSRSLDIDLYILSRCCL